MKNAIKQRLPKSAENLKQLESKFIEGVEKTALQDLSLDELANRFEDIGQQAQLLQGQILLEARNRLGSDKEFGKWCASHSICVGSQQQRNRLIHLARFFEGRELDRISISAAYEISAPANKKIAEEIYEYAKGKNLPLAEVRRQIAIRKGESLPLPAKRLEPATDITPTTPKAAMDISEKVEIVATNLELSKQEQIMKILEGLTGGEAKKLLRDCLHAVKW